MGPLLAGVAVSLSGFGLTYGLDAARPVLLMTFVVDIDAVLSAYPRALFPALA